MKRLGTGNQISRCTYIGSRSPTCHWQVTWTSVYGTALPTCEVMPARWRRRLPLIAIAMEFRAWGASCATEPGAGSIMAIDSDLQCRSNAQKLVGGRSRGGEGGEGKGGGRGDRSRNNARSPKTSRLRQMLLRLLLLLQLPGCTQLLPCRLRRRGYGMKKRIPATVPTSLSPHLHEQRTDGRNAIPSVFPKEGTGALL